VAARQPQVLDEGKYSVDREDADYSSLEELPALAFAGNYRRHNEAANDEENINAESHEVREFSDSPGAKRLSCMQPCHKKDRDRPQYLNAFNLRQFI
jgi:hypothetical protein